MIKLFNKNRKAAPSPPSDPLLKGRVSRDYVVWGYRVFLGRDPENEAVVMDKESRLSSVGALRSEFLASSEFYSDGCRARRTAIPLTADHIHWAKALLLDKALAGPIAETITDVDSLIHFLMESHSANDPEHIHIHLKKSARILILGNCQTDQLTLILSHMGGFQAKNIREDALCDRKVQDHSLETFNNCDFIITQPLSSDHFGPFQTEEIKRHAKPIMVIPNIYFSGLQPDLIYVGKMGKRYQSPLGDYHSAIAIAAFLEGYSIEQTKTLFRKEYLFQEAGFFDEWRQSLNEFRVREMFCDIRLCDEIEDSLKKRPLFYAPNHPSLELITLLATQIMTRLECNPGWFSFWRDELHLNVIYPVWDVIALHHRLCYRSPEIFFVHPSKGGKLDLDDYLRQAFRDYQKRLPEEAHRHPKVIKLRSLLNPFTES